MFRVENNVPEVYVQESRDFQLLSRLYDLVIQSSRFSIDSLRNVSDTIHCNDSILPLIGTKVGFFERKEFTDASYRKVLSAFPHIIRMKGSLKGLYLVANLFERLTNTSVDVNFDSSTGSVEFRFEKYKPDQELLFDLIEYVRPTGLIVRCVIAEATRNDTQYLVTTEPSKTEDQNDAAESVVNTAVVGLSVVLGDANYEQ